MSLAVTDDSGPFEAHIRRNRSALARLARRLAGNREDAEDLLQETLLDAFRAFHRFRADSHFYRWAARIMINNNLDRVRRRREAVLPFDELRDGCRSAPPDADPEHSLMFGELEDTLAQAVSALQPRQRAAVELCDLLGASYREAAELEACPVGTIRSRLHRAHRALRLRLTGAGESRGPRSAEECV